MDRINGANTVDIGSGRRGFRSQNKASGVAGTEMTAAFFNALQEEIMAVIEGAGLTGSAESWTQLRQAIAAMISAATPEVDMSPYLQKAGGTMSGPLVLAGAPEADGEAATKAYADGVSSLAASGYVRFPGGLLLQWVKPDELTALTGTLTLDWPVAFAAACIGRWVSSISTESAETASFFGLTGVTSLSTVSIIYSAESLDIELPVVLGLGY
jgi:hypothetical protein